MVAGPSGGGSRDGRGALRVAGRALAVDWSGDKSAGHRKIWLCEVSAGRVVRLENGRDRAQMASHLLSEAKRNPEFVVGLDFAFSFPAAFLRKRGHREIGSVWAEVEESGEDWLATCPNPPFWGKPGKKKPALGNALHRATEVAVAGESGLRPMSVFQIGGAGAVGVGSIRGMPILRELQRKGFAIWPFDQPRLDRGAPLVVEIWPRLFMGSVVKSRRAERRTFLDRLEADFSPGIRAAAEASDDAFDALVSGLALDRHLAKLASLRRGHQARVMLEGEIWRPSPPGK